MTLSGRNKIYGRRVIWYPVYFICMWSPFAKLSLSFSLTLQRRPDYYAGMLSRHKPREGIVSCWEWLIVSPGKVGTRVRAYIHAPYITHIYAPNVHTYTHITPTCNGYKGMRTLPHQSVLFAVDNFFPEFLSAS